jgi:hypothetical protein
MNRSKLWLLPFALTPLFAAPAAAQDGVVDLDTAVRCSAAFRIIASEQQRGVASAKADYPPLGERGKEFFVQTAARLMDEQKLDRPQLQARFRAEIGKLQNEAITSPDPAATVRKVMTPCLALLDATVPPRR